MVGDQWTIQINMLKIRSSLGYGKTVVGEFKPLSHNDIIYPERTLLLVWVIVIWKNRDWQNASHDSFILSLNLSLTGSALILCWPM